MNLIAKKFLGTGLVLGLTAVSLAAQSASQFGNLPLWFEAGQPARFVAHASDSEFTIIAAGTEFSLTSKNGETAVCQLQFVGANPAARISGDQKLAGTINHFHGNDPSQWQANVPTFAQVQVEDIYPGVNLVYYGNRQQLEYDFNLAAGVNPAVIALHFDGAKKVSVNRQGELVIHFSSGDVVQHPPVAYQTIQGARQEIAAGYKMLDAHTAAFALGRYDHSEPLVIDPVLSYSTFFGGNFGDTGWAIAVNPIDGSIYVAGQTFSTKDSNNIPALTLSTPNVIQTNYLGGKLTGDAFIARFDASGTNLIYATYLGGSAGDAAYAIAVDNLGNAFIAGSTRSTNFPVINPLAGENVIGGKIDRHTGQYPNDAFIAELNPTGTGLVYSTYLGGNGYDYAFGIALDAADNAFVTGNTYSTNFPVTPNAFQSRMMCSNSVYPTTAYINANAFVTEISTNGPSLLYSTYLGGTNYDVGRAIAYNSGKLFVAGYTSSTNFPVVNYILETNIIWTNTIYKKDHGTNTSYPVLITNVFNGQYLNSCYTNKHNARFDLAPDAFVTAFDTTANTNWGLLYSTYLGGTNNDQATGIAADTDGNAYVVGFTTSTNFPNTLSDLTASYVHTNGYLYEFATNGFLTKIVYQSGTNASIGYSAMFGGRGLDVANGVALDSFNNVYVVGSATSTNFPVTTNNLYGGLSTTNHIIKKRYRSDVFVIAFTSDASALLYSCYIGGWENDYGNAIAVDPIGNAYIAGQTLSTNFPTSVDPFQAHRNGTNDMFIAKISQADPPVPALVISTGDSAPAAQAKIAGSPPFSPPGITLKWQMFPANYDVESSTDLTPGSWHLVPGSPAYSNGWYQVTLPTTNGVQFFRLHQH